MSEKSKKIVYVRRGELVEGLTPDEIKPDAPPQPKPGHTIIDYTVYPQPKQLSYEDLTNDMKFSQSIVREKYSGSDIEIPIAEKSFRAGWLRIRYYHPHTNKRITITYEEGKETKIEELDGWM